jgi:dihydroorotase
VTETVDLLIRGGVVFDPGSGLDEKRDVAVRGGRIVAIQPNVPRESARQVIDASGCYVSPGFVDLHAHVYWGVNYFAVEADPHCSATGVTTVVDTGSAGSVNFPGLRRYVVEKSRTRILAFVNIARYGVQPAAQPRPTGELRDIAYADPEGAAEQAKRNSDIAVGIKVRMGSAIVGDNGRAVLRMALQAAEMAGTRVMAHIGGPPLGGAGPQSHQNSGSPVPVEEIVDSLRPGDIVTHCFAGLEQSIVDESGKLRAAVRRAHERGVLFDLGHASNYMMDFDVARAAMAQGLKPDTLSTDSYVIRRPGVRDPGFDLPAVLTKFLALGWSLGEVIAACTVRPAKAIGWEDRIGRLGVGREADISVFTVRDGPVTLYDTEGKTIQGDRTLEPLWTIRSGQPYPAKGNPGFKKSGG